MIIAHLDASTTGHALDAEFDLLGLPVERTVALYQGGTLEHVIPHRDGGKRGLESMKDSGKGGLENVGEGHYSDMVRVSTPGMDRGGGEDGEGSALLKCAAVIARSKGR